MLESGTRKYLPLVAAGWMANCISRRRLRELARGWHVAASPSSARWRGDGLSIVSKSCHGHRDESGVESSRWCDTGLGAYACSESLYRVSPAWAAGTSRFRAEAIASRFQPLIATATRADRPTPSRRTAGAPARRLVETWPSVMFVSASIHSSAARSRSCSKSLPPSIEAVEALLGLANARASFQCMSCIRAALICEARSLSRWTSFARGRSRGCPLQSIIARTPRPTRRRSSGVVHRILRCSTPLSQGCEEDDD